MLRVAAAALLVASSSATAQAIPLHPGETVTVDIENGTAVVEQRSPARPISKFEIYALWRAETQEIPPGVKVVPPGSVVEGEGPPAPVHPAGDQLRFTLRMVPGPGLAREHRAVH